ncbi:chromosome segregation protein SMC, partial [Candidatus Woesearchaeota archaeon]|nr:chromosome segregation protein SMC [Candidatus Woesearchaeota archaeon]
GTRITKLVMDGFKSFGKRTELLFENGFNVVMGPNGSGKSNILDALCFVLGKSSSKSLRAEKSANLIYNGGKTKKSAKAAEVSISFDNSKRVFPVEEDVVKVSRIVKANGVSKYKINNKTRTRQEVVELLGLAKINPDGYNIILQGDIVKLVEMSPVERRQIIEEIAGISVYEEKKNKALSELEKVEQKLNEAGIILKERQTHLRELKKDRDQALKYRELSDKIKQNKASYIKKRMNKKESELKEIEKRADSRKTKLNSLQSEIKDFRDKISDKKKLIQEISDEIEAKGGVEQAALQKEIEKLRVDIATLKAKVSSHKNELGRIAQRKDQLGANFKELEEKTSFISEQRKELVEKKNFFASNIGELNQKISAFKKKHKLDESGEIEKKVEEIDKKAEKKQAEIQSLREKQQSLLREKDKNEFQIEAIDDQIKKVKSLERKHKDEIDILKNKKNQFKKMVLELNELLNKDSDNAVKLADSKRNVQSFKEKLEKLKVKNAGIKEHLSANIAVKKVFENRNQLGQIYGTVSELGTVNEKYSLALEIAAAHKINSVVVDDDKVASNCIKFLKKNKFGVAAFLPLNKIRPNPVKPNIKSLTKQSGVVGMAVDLIDFDPKFKDIFSYVFGNTLIVNSIDTARKIGIGKVKMVSLDGDLAEVSGAMIGGFRHKTKGSFKHKDLTDDIKNLEKDIKSRDSDINKLEKVRVDNELKINKLRELKANLEGEIIKTEKSLHLDSADLDASNQYKQELKKNIEKIGKDIEDIENKIADETQLLTELKIEKQNLRNQISELRNPRLLAELNSFEQKKREFSEDSIKVDAELKNLDVQEKEMVGRDKENTGKVLKELEKEEKSFNSEIKGFEVDIKSFSSGLVKKEKQQEILHTQFKGLFGKRKKHSDEISSMESKIFGLEDNARKLEISVNTLSIEEAKLKAEFAGMNAEFAQYEGVELNMKKSEEELKKEIMSFERMMSNIGSVNMRALEIYETVEKEFNILMEKKGMLSEEKESVLNLMDQIEANKKDLFVEALEVVNKNFRDIFQNLSTKGDAYLELENPEQPFEAGMRIKVKLTSDKFMDIRSLSGGEKTLTALAFLFAIQEHEPASFYVLDEVDAALDKTNSEKLAKLIRDYCNKAQYVVISHNDSVISEGDILYGVSMKPETGLSAVVSLKA